MMFFTTHGLLGNPNKSIPFSKFSISRILFVFLGFYYSEGKQQMLEREKSFEFDIQNLFRTHEM